MSSTDPLTEEDHALAGELALGLLADEAARAARQRTANDQSFAAAAREWEARLSAFGEEATAQAPPPGVKARIDQALFGTPGRVPAPSRPLGRTVRAWQAAAAALGALAVLEFGLLLLTRAGQEPEAERVAAPAPAPVILPEANPFVAALVPSDAQAPVVVSLDVPAGVLRVDPSSIAADGRAVQLWLLPTDGGDPVSLGVLTPNTDNTLRLELVGPLAAGDLPSLAISLEPVGGSPTGLPTGPIVATGAVREL